MATLTTCNMGSTIIDLNTLLINADAGGTWTDESTSPTDGFNVNTFDPNNQAGGTYTFRYTSTNNGCPEDFSDVSVTVEAQQAAILDQTTLMPCNDQNGSNISIVSLNDLVLFSSVPGTWEDTDGTGVDLSDLDNVDFAGLTPSFYTTYVQSFPGAALNGCDSSDVMLCRFYWNHPEHGISLQVSRRQCSGKYAVTEKRFFYLSRRCLFYRK